MSATWAPTLTPAAPPKEGVISRPGRATLYKPQTRVHRSGASHYPARTPSQGVHTRASAGKTPRVWGSTSTSGNEHAEKTPQPARRVWRGTKAKQQALDAVSEVKPAAASEPTGFKMAGDVTNCDDVPAIAELTSDNFLNHKDDTCEDTVAETTSSVKVVSNAAEPSGQEESLVPELAQAGEQDHVVHKTKRVRNRYPKQVYVAEMDWPSPDPEEEKAIIKRTALENAITWCKSLLPREIEQKTIEDCADYEALDGAEMLLSKGMRMSNLVYIEPTVNKKVSKKVKPSRTRDTIKHTAETLRIFSFLKIQAPLLVADVAPTLKALQKRLNSDTLEISDQQSADEELTEVEGSATIVDAEASADNSPLENSPRPPLPDIQVKLESLAEEATNRDSCEQALRDIFLLLHEEGRPIEPFFVCILPSILSSAGNEDLDVSDKVIFLIESFFDLMSPYAVDVIMPVLLEGIGKKAKPSLKLLVLGLISKLAAAYPKCIGYELVALVPLVADLTCDAKKEIRTEAVRCMNAICACTGNMDLEPFLPFVVEAAQSISNTHLCVEKLAGCIFVQSVEMPALAVLLPVLQRGLNDRTEEIVRTCCQIVDNMCKLVDDPVELLPLLPQLQPLVASAVERIADPEARSIAEKALETLEKSAGKAGSVRVTSEEVLNILEGAICDGKEASRATILHVAKLVAMATNMHCFSPEDWSSNIGFATPFDAIIEDVRKRMEVASQAEEEIEEDDDGVDLYRGVFSLAYGTHTLLRDARMHLKRNRFYGLLGPNQCGKTTLMRAIANEQLEGFPKRSELKSVFVEHEIQDEEVDVQADGFPIMSVDKPGWWWVMHTCNDIYKMEVPVEEQQVKDLMKQIGFGYPGGPDRAANLDNPVTTYSGGWKMKMQLCAAQLMEADILMLDEPTGHLDVDNIRWLEKWLDEFPGSIICVSHFSPFLDKMCTHIIDFQERKLKTFKGVKGSTLSGFVQKFPDKKAYFELSNETMQFKFSLPGPLNGVKSRSKVILRMSSVSYTYPTKDKPTISDVSLTVSQVSRVAVIGANGAGKTTAIKVLVGEMEPTEGTIWKATGLRMAYVAQHAIHHLQKHLQETPTQYIMWRFAGNEDKESLEFKADELTVDENEARAVNWCIDGATGAVRRCISAEEDVRKNKQDANNIVVPDAILERRQRKKEKIYEYRVKWQFKPVDAACWVEREVLIQMGYLKLVQMEDEKQAAMSGLMTKQLTQQGIETHLRDFGIDAESASHTMINQLSGGMKVKVVLAAAMWQNPHVLILDEPTNYLDREGLGALATAIRDYQGGVLVISHNREFCDSVAHEKWIMNKGQLRIEGESLGTGDQKNDAQEVQDEIIDGAGNKISINRSGNLSEKERKREIKELEKKIKEEKKKSSPREEELWELQDRLQELKEHVDDA